MRFLVRILAAAFALARARNRARRRPTSAASSKNVPAPSRRTSPRRAAGPARRRSIRSASPSRRSSSSVVGVGVGVLPLRREARVSSRRLGERGGGVRRAPTNPAASARAAACRTASRLSPPTSYVLGGAASLPGFLASARSARTRRSRTYSRIFSDASLACALSLMRACTRRRWRWSSRLARAESSRSPSGLKRAPAEAAEVDAIADADADASSSPGGERAIRRARRCERPRRRPRGERPSPAE